MFKALLPSLVMLFAILTCAIIVACTTETTTTTTTTHASVRDHAFRVGPEITLTSASDELISHEGKTIETVELVPNAVDDSSQADVLNITFTDGTELSVAAGHHHFNFAR